MASQRYRIRVAGELSGEAGEAFEGMTIVREEGSTALTGFVRDQSELQGLLLRVSSMGLTLLSAAAVDDDRRS